MHNTRSYGHFVIWRGPGLYNPLMPRRYFCTSIYFIVYSYNLEFIVFKKQMLQSASTDLVNLKLTIVCQNLLFPLQITAVDVSQS